MPEVHANLSPSAAERWMNCPGSVVLCEGMPEKTSPYADEGTAAHALAEKILKQEPVPSDPEMEKNVRVYTDVVEALNQPGCVLHVEKRVKVTPEVWGTADAIVWDPKTATLYVRDLKYGTGLVVEVSDNLQLKIYALAALLTMKYPAKIVNVGVVQPRYPHSDGFSRSKDFDAVDLIDFHADLVHAINGVANAQTDIEKGNQAWNDRYLHPTGKGCRWCLAAPVCPKLKQMAKDEAKKVFAKDVPYDPAELAKTLDTLDILEGWIKNTREFAYGQAEGGIPIPHYKLVEKQAKRVWKSGIAEELAKALGVAKQALFEDAPMKGVTEIQKLAPGKNDKLRAEVLAPFVTKESSGHTLVHESDQREAVRIDAQTAFT